MWRTYYGTHRTGFTFLNQIANKQARQTEELEHLRRMVDKNPEVIRFAMECQTLRGTALVPVAKRW